MQNPFDIHSTFVLFLILQNHQMNLTFGRTHMPGNQSIHKTCTYNYYDSQFFV